MRQFSSGLELLPLLSRICTLFMTTTTKITIAATTPTTVNRDYIGKAVVEL